MAVQIPMPGERATPTPKSSYQPVPYSVARPVLYSEGAALYAGNAAARAFEGVASELNTWSEQIDRTQAQDALNQLRAKRQELTSGEGGYLGVQGGNVLNQGGEKGTSMFETYPQKYEAYAHELYDKLSGNRARIAFREAAQADITGFRQEIGLHGINESKKYMEQVSKETELQIQNGAVGETDPDKLGALEELARGNAKTRAMRIPGADPDLHANMAGSSIYRIAIEQAVKTGNIATASQIYNAHKDRLFGKDRADMDDTMAGVQTQLNARGQSGQYRTPTPTAPPAGPEVRARIDQSMNFWQERGYTKEQAAAMTGSFQRESQFNTRALNPNDAGPGKDSVGIAQWNQERLTRLMQKSNPYDFETQLKFADQELNETGIGARLKATRGIAEASMLLSTQFFRGLNQTSDAGKATGHATAILTSYGEPVTKAQPAPLTGLGGFGGAPQAINVPATPAAPVAPPEPNGSTWQDTDQMLTAENDLHVSAMAKNRDANGTNPRQFNATQQQLELDHAAEVNRINGISNHLKADINTFLQTRPTGDIPVDLKNRMSWKQTAEVNTVIKANATGVVPVTNFGVWYKLQKALTGNDPALRKQAAEYDLELAAPYLSPEDRKGLATLQAAARAHDEPKLTQIGSDMEQVDLALRRALGVTKMSEVTLDQLGAFHLAIQNEMNAREQIKGKLLDPKDKQQVIDDAVRKIPSQPGWFGSLFGSSPTQPRALMTIDQVPTAARDTIGKMIGANVPSDARDAAIVGAYSISDREKTGIVQRIRGAQQRAGHASFAVPTDAEIWRFYIADHYGVR